MEAAIDKADDEDDMPTYLALTHHKDHTLDTLLLKATVLQRDGYSFSEIISILQLTEVSLISSLNNSL